MNRSLFTWRVAACLFTGMALAACSKAPDPVLNTAASQFTLQHNSEVARATDLVDKPNS